MLGFLQQNGLKAKSVPDWQGFLSAHEPLMITVAPLAYGFKLEDQNIRGYYRIRSLSICCPLAQTSSQEARRRFRRPVARPCRNQHRRTRVHEEHGIGRYMGLVTMDLGGETNEMMLLEYAGEAQLYVPVSQLHLISRYSGQAHENVTLHKLGSGAWNKAKRKAAEKARDTAAELLNLYAQRAAQSGHKFEINELDYQAFADGFGYEETEDQAAAIAAVIKDLTQAKPMDRLVCGDVGFGKTEVALRAAFVAVMGGKQVAVLAPTTLLVEQHAQTSPTARRFPRESCQSFAFQQ